MSALANALKRAAGVAEEKVDPNYKDPYYVRKNNSRQVLDKLKDNNDKNKKDKK